MNIVMLTNTFSPYVGGVARSVQCFVKEYRRQGHQVFVAAPLYKTTPSNEENVLRFPSIQHFNGSEFSLPMPIPGKLGAALKGFKPDVVHAHHPFALGGTALRVATAHHIPLVFTHHTMYEKYTHYIPGDSLRLKRYVVSLVTGYCSFCDAVIAPSESVANLLRTRGVSTRTEVIPTGVETAMFTEGHSNAFRKEIDLPDDAFVVGHVGRMATEKNLEFLARSVTRFLKTQSHAYFLLVGTGPMKAEIKQIFEEQGLSKRLRCPGLLQKNQLANAYKAMDVFAFSSHTETQGMVLAEAMTSGVPVVAVDATGVREMIEDGVNGRLLSHDDEEGFSQALQWIAALEREEKFRLVKHARQAAAECDISRTANKAILLYQSLIEQKRTNKPLNGEVWTTTRRSLKSEWKIARNIAKAAGTLFRPLSVEDKKTLSIDPNNCQ